MYYERICVGNYMLIILLIQIHDNQTKSNTVLLPKWAIRTRLLNCFYPIYPQLLTNFNFKRTIGNTDYTFELFEYFRFGKSPILYGIHCVRCPVAKDLPHVFEDNNIFTHLTYLTTDQQLVGNSKNDSALYSAWRSTLRLCYALRVIPKRVNSHK